MTRTPWNKPWSSTGTAAHGKACAAQAPNAVASCLAWTPPRPATSGRWATPPRSTGHLSPWPCTAADPARDLGWARGSTWRSAAAPGLSGGVRSGCQVAGSGGIGAGPRRGELAHGPTIAPWRASGGRPGPSLPGTNSPPGGLGPAAFCQAATTSPNPPTCSPPRTRRRHAVLQPWLRLGRPPLPGVARTMRARTPKAKSSCSPWIKLPAARSSTRYSSTRSPGARQPATGRDEIRVQRGSHGHRAGPGDVGSADGTRDPRDLPSSWLCGDDNPQILMCAAGPGADHDNLLPAHHPGLVDPQAGPLRWRRLATCGPD